MQKPCAMSCGRLQVQTAAKAYGLLKYKEPLKKFQIFLVLHESHG